MSMDRIAYLDHIRDACERYGVARWVYCLMSNHVHFVVVPSEAGSLYRCFSEAHVGMPVWLSLQELPLPCYEKGRKCGGRRYIY